MFRVLSVVAGAAVGAALYGFGKSFQPNLETEINRQEKCAVCNKPLSENKFILRCKRHAVHEGCRKTLRAEGQKTCPVCPDIF